MALSIRDYSVVRVVQATHHQGDVRYGASRVIMSCILLCHVTMSCYYVMLLCHVIMSCCYVMYVTVMLLCSCVSLISVSWTLFKYPGLWDRFDLD